MGNESVWLTKAIDVPLYVPSKNGQVAYFKRTFNIVRNLGTPVLIGGNILKAEQMTFCTTMGW